MIVLSLFDGMSCGQIALKKLGVNVLRYYASEIDKHAIAQTQFNFPDTIQLGDVENWRSWNIDWKSIDIILAGSPCQGFSFAGKQLAFDDPRSKLFFVFIDILNHIRKLNPNVKFLLENVDMKREHMRIITEYCGVFPVNINSNLVSAQNRNRWYWTNIRTKSVGLFGEVHSDIPQPKDREELLRDILESDVDEKYYLSDKIINGFLNKPIEWAKTFKPKEEFGNEKANCLNSRLHKMGAQDNYIKIDKKGNPKADQNKVSCFTAGGNSGGNHSDMDLICLTPRRTEYGKLIRKEYERGTISEKRMNIQQLEPRIDGKTNTLTTVQKDNLIIQRSRGFNKGGVYEDKTPTLSSNSWEQNNLLQNNNRIRRLTPTECSRLQTIPEWYKWKCSDTQQYKMLGNGWTVEVIVWILSFMFIEVEKKEYQY